MKKIIPVLLLLAMLLPRYSPTVTTRWNVEVFDLVDAVVMVIPGNTAVKLLDFDRPGEYLNNKTRDCFVSWYADNEFGENRYHETWLGCYNLSLTN